MSDQDCTLYVSDDGEVFVKVFWPGATLGSVRLFDEPLDDLQVGNESEEMEE